jgi:hypothetical protein
MATGLRVQAANSMKKMQFDSGNSAFVPCGSGFIFPTGLSQASWSVVVCLHLSAYRRRCAASSGLSHQPISN